MDRMKRYGPRGEDFSVSMPDASYISEANSPGIYCFIVQVVQYYDLQVFDGSKRGVLQIRDGTYNRNFSCQKYATKSHCRVLQSVKGINVLVINASELPTVQAGEFYKISNVRVVKSQVDENFMLMYVDGKEAFPTLIKSFVPFISKRKIFIKKARKKLLKEKFFKTDVLLYNFVGILKINPPFDWNSNYVPISKACTECKTRLKPSCDVCTNEICKSKSFSEPEFYVEFTMMSVCCTILVLLSGKDAESFFGISAEKVLESVKAKEYIKCYIVCLLNIGLEGLQMKIKPIEEPDGEFSFHITDTSFKFPSLPDLSED